MRTMIMGNYLTSYCQVFGNFSLNETIETDIYFWSEDEEGRRRRRRTVPNFIKKANFKRNPFVKCLTITVLHLVSCFLVTAAVVVFYTQKMLQNEKNVNEHTHIHFVDDSFQFQFTFQCKFPF